MNTTEADLDARVRVTVYDETMRSGFPPSGEILAAALGIRRDAVMGSLARLAAGKVLVLQDNGEILMANPYSAVPTPFVVQFGDRTAYGNCIWDALGVLAMAGADGTISASCGDCGTAMNLRVEAGVVHGDTGLVHFAIPARSWWDDIVFN